ncbi:dihydrofolate reductase family protein [Amycolatopsis sp. OK19-0408]|uniref:Dihydrofolate reductase family protein n=1 Tax=Amycolatopsis iheyensis TaxID=2945988 RepID=A0A9X2SRN4_9PSEU|nr:dihydrofolate reductase family protein [Amycolatopsis iheyensis]MCR6490330.1 dihydrofolate reductase family protein [Amycolatopsis iheyensis]
MIRQIWPVERGLDDHELEQLYTYPADPKWLAVNFVSSTDGAIAVEGRSASLSTPADRIVYRLGNDLADVVLLGAGTAVAEGFEGMRPDEPSADRRRRFGLAPIAPVAVVTTGRSLPPDAPVITKAAVPTIVFTCAAAPVELRNAWAANGARVFVVGETEVSAELAVATLVAEGLGRIDCEGGPRLFGSLIAAGVVDEFRLTVAPFLVSGTASRAALGGAIDPAKLELASVLTDGSSVLLRYLNPQ